MASPSTTLVSKHKHIRVAVQRTAGRGRKRCASGGQRRGYLRSVGGLCIHRLTMDEVLSLSLTLPNTLTLTDRNTVGKGCLLALSTLPLIHRTAGGNCLEKRNGHRIEAPSAAKWG